MACASRERMDEARRRFWDWVGVASWQGQAGHNIVKVRSISKMHIPKLLLQLNIILGIGFAYHSQVIQELSHNFLEQAASAAVLTLGLLK